MRPLLFAIGSVLLATISRKSLLRPRSHGFYRFLAWEAILGLLLINAQSWFRDPFHWHQIVSWLLLLVSIIPLVLGIAELRSRGGAGADASRDPELLGFERTTALVKDGIFGLIRHPLYASLLLLGWGIFFKEPSAWSGVLITVATLLLVVTARRDEAECLQVFGAEYRQYMQHTRMFIPYVL